MTDELIEEGARLGLFIDKVYGKNISFAIAYGYSKGFVSRMVNGKVAIPKDLVKSLSTGKPPLNSQWLLTGDGEMFLGKKYEVGAPEMRVVGEPVEEEDALRPLRVLEKLLETLVRNHADLERRLAAIEAKQKTE